MGSLKSQTRLSDFTFTFHFPALEKATAAHSSVLSWGIPGMGEPGGLLSMGDLAEQQQRTDSDTGKEIFVLKEQAVTEYKG